MNAGGAASRIVLSIDWKRARQRLLNFVGKQEAIELLAEAARQEVGHMDWLKAGGERLLFKGMQAMRADAFRTGDRQDEVLSENGAQALLIEVLRMASQALLHKQPIALMAD